jgi:hypothetical protein
MTNKDDSEVLKIEGRLTATQGLWDCQLPTTKSRGPVEIRAAG